MRYLLIFLNAIWLLTLVVCDGQNTIPDKTDNPKSLEFWSADTIITLNPRLVALMDTLYQYTRNEYSEKNINANIQWMRNYRKQLCKYFIDTHKSDSISEFAMADSIIAEADALWELDNNYSTMGMIVGNDIKRTRLIFVQFNEYDKLNSICNSEEQRKMLLAEFNEWLRLEKLFSEFYANCVDLHFWGGSISGPIRTAGILSIWITHISLYKKEYSILTKSVDGWDDNGTFLTPAYDLLISCCNQAIEEYYSSDITDEDYRYQYEKTKNLLKQLPVKIDSWCKARNPWENEMCTDWLRPEYPRHTSEVLIGLANIISSVQ